MKTFTEQEFNWMTPITAPSDRDYDEWIHFYDEVPLFESIEENNLDKELLMETVGYAFEMPNSEDGIKFYPRCIGFYTDFVKDQFRIDYLDNKGEYHTDTFTIEDVGSHTTMNQKEWDNFAEAMEKWKRNKYKTIEK